MKKTARKKSQNQAPTPQAQRTLHLASVVRRNLYAFVIQEGMKALDVMLEQDREALCGTPHKKNKSDDPERWGHTEGRLVMGGQRVIVNKPRVRHQGTFGGQTRIARPRMRGPLCSAWGVWSCSSGRPAVAARRGFREQALAATSGDDRTVASRACSKSIIGYSSLTPSAERQRLCVRRGCEEGQRLVRTLAKASRGD